MMNIAQKTHDLFQAMKPKCVRRMESALRELQGVTDETLHLVKKNGHALEKANPCHPSFNGPKAH